MRRLALTNPASSLSGAHPSEGHADAEASRQVFWLMSVRAVVVTTVLLSALLVQSITGSDFIELNPIYYLVGFTYLLTLGARVLTVMEFVLRRSLEEDQAELGFAPGEQEKDDRQANGETDPESLFGYFIDDHQKRRRRRDLASADTPVRVAGRRLATAEARCFPLWAA